jgi:site-specific DNA-methyltransferase (adenine-specific)
VSAILHLGDCLDPVTGMAALPDKSIDVVITDPPYSEHVHAKSRRGLAVTHVDGARNEISERRDMGFESLTSDVMEAAADQFARLASRWVLVFCDIESAHLWRGAMVSGGLEYLRTCAWHKIGGAPQFTGDRPAVWGEAIVVCHPKGRKRWNGGGKQGLYAVPTAIDRDRSGLDARIHTTQKPVKLMQDLIRDFTDEGETILDPFAGSGTTLFAAARLGRKAIGWEKDPANYAAALERLASVGREPGTPATQTGLFE